MVRGGSLHDLQRWDDGGDFAMRLRSRRYNLTPIPLQLPDVSHADELVERTYRRLTEVDGLRPATVRWMRDAYRSLRAFLREDHQRETTFLSGNAVQQMRLVEEWVAGLRRRGVSVTSIRTYWRGLESLLRHIEASEGFFNPLSQLVPPKAAAPLPKAITKTAAEQVMHFLRNYPWSSPFERHRNLALVGLMLLAGLRKSEVLRLTVADVDVDAATIRIARGKGRNGGKDRTAYMTPQLIVLLRLYEGARRAAKRSHAEYISSVRGDRRIGEVTIRRLLSLVSSRLKVHVTPHMLRHTYATLLRQSGVPDRIAQELLGHSSLAMLQRYSHVFDGECSTQAARLQLDF
jgi:integrase